HVSPAVRRICPRPACHSRDRSQRPHLADAASVSRIAPKLGRHRPGMDDLTHSLTGLMFSRAGLNRFHPRASLILIMAANAPDVDIVSWFGGPLTYLEYHRGLAHSL